MSVHCRRMRNVWPGCASVVSSAITIRARGERDPQFENKYFPGAFYFWGSRSRTRKYFQSARVTYLLCCNQYRERRERRTLNNQLAPKQFVRKEYRMRCCSGICFVPLSYVGQLTASKPCCLLAVLFRACLVQFCNANNECMLLVLESIT